MRSTHAPTGLTLSMVHNVTTHVRIMVPVASDRRIPGPEALVSDSLAVLDMHRVASSIALRLSVRRSTVLIYSTWLEDK